MTGKNCIHGFRGLRLWLCSDRFSTYRKTPLDKLLGWDTATQKANKTGSCILSCNRPPSPDEPPIKFLATGRER